VTGHPSAGKRARTRPSRTLAGHLERHRAAAAEAGLGPDSGQATWLAIGYALIALVLITVVVSASAVHLERKRLLALADLAALDAADAIDAAAYYGRRGDVPGSLVVLGEGEVRAEVVDYLTAAAPEARLADLALVDARTDGRTATVTLHAVAHPPLLSWVLAPWSDGIDLVVTSSARTG
jgi:hypothetical protein